MLLVEMNSHSYNHTFIRYSEIALKGNNRREFEKQLIRNIKSCYAAHGIDTVYISQPRGRIILHVPMINALKRVFGIHSLSQCIEVDQSEEAIRKVLESNLSGFDQTTTFRVSVQRTDKQFPLTSMDLERNLGAFVVEKTNAKVSLKDYQKEVGIELVNGKAYLYFEKIPCLGGMPVSSQGVAYLNLCENSTKDHLLLAGILMLKRGVALKVVLNSPYVGSQKQTICDCNMDKLISFLSLFSYGSEVSSTEYNTIHKKHDSITLISGLRTPPSSKKSSIHTKESTVSIQNKDLISQKDLLLYPLVGLSDSECSSLIKNYGSTLEGEKISL